MASTHTATPLIRRPLDAFYVVYLLLHLLGSTLLDAQFLLPKRWWPMTLQNVLAGFLKQSNDPLFRHGAEPWLKSYLWTGLLFQCPVFIVGSLALIRDDKRVYPLLLAYAAHASTTVLGCLATIVSDSQITGEQLRLLLYSYAPYLIITLIMSVDLGHRLTAVMQSRAGKTKQL